MGLALGGFAGAARPHVAELAYSERHEQYVPAQTRRNERAFQRDGDGNGRDALGVRETPLAYAAPSAHLKRPPVLVNKRGELERRRSVDGDGLYARQDLPRFTVVGEYRGEIIEDAARARGKSSYRFAVVDLESGRTVRTIDGKDEAASSIARYANAADTLEQVNAEFVQFRGRVFLVATRPIAAREEIITWYGEDTDVINSAPKRKRASIRPKRQRDLFLLERIVARRRRAGNDEFLVKWQGYTDEHNSWVPEADIFDDEELERARKLRVQGGEPGRK